MPIRRVLLTLAVSATTAAAQQTTWTATATSGAESYNGSNTPSAWLWELLGIRAATGRNSFGIEGIASRRFDEWDHTIAGETYLGLAKSSYVYFRAQLTPNAKVLPSSDLSGEFYQAFALDWEASASLRHMSFPVSGTTIATLGLARTFKNYNFRARYITLVRADSGSAPAFAFTARRYGAVADSYVEAGISTGHEVVSIGADQSYDIRTSNSGYLRAQRFVTSQFGLAGLLSFAKQSGIPERTGLYVSVMSRW